MEVNSLVEYGGSRGRVVDHPGSGVSSIGRGLIEELDGDGIKEDDDDGDDDDNNIEDIVGAV